MAPGRGRAARASSASCGGSLAQIGALVVRAGGVRLSGAGGAGLGGAAAAAGGVRRRWTLCSTLCWATTGGRSWAWCSVRGGCAGGGRAGERGAGRGGRAAGADRISRAAVLFVWCGYVGVKNRTETLVQSFNFCAFCCAVVAAVGVALTWEELQNSRDYCSGKIHHDQETNQVFEGECDGKHVRQSLVTNAALSTTLLVIIGVLECAAGWFSWTLLKDGKTLFVQPYAPGQVVVGQPVYVPAQSFASSTQPAAFQSPASVDP